MSGTEPSKLKHLTGLIDSAKLSLGVPGVLNAEVGVNRHDSAAVPASAAEAFKIALIAATDAIKEDDGAGLAIFVDEIQSADRESLWVIAYAWQELTSERAATPAGIFGAGLPNSPEAIAAAVTFSERFDYRPLPALHDNDVALALVAPAQDAGVHWDPAALRLAVESAGEYPHKVQVVGDESWRAAGWPDPGTMITEETVRAALAEVERQMTELFRAPWNSATRAEREVLHAMAALGGHDVKREDLAAALGMSTVAISGSRARLLRKGIIESSRFGYLSFSVPGFIEYILESESG